MRESFVELPLLRAAPTDFLSGGTTPRLRDHMANAKITVPAQAIEVFARPFNIG